MSGEKILNTTTSVASAVDRMLKDKYKISVLYNNSYYVYSCDKVPVLIVSRDLNCQGESSNCVLQTLNIPNFSARDLDEEFNNSLCFHISGASEKNKSEKADKEISFANIVKKCGQYENMNKQDSMENLVSWLIYHKCPIKVIKRILYFFDNPKSEEKDFPDAFYFLNHDARLVEYKTDNANKWFFAGENHMGRFMQMGVKSKQIFDKVKSALQNQQQCVK